MSFQDYFTANPFHLPTRSERKEDKRDGRRFSHRTKTQMIKIFFFFLKHTGEAKIQVCML